jgi:hypothetical protein
MSAITKPVSLSLIYNELGEFFASAPTIQQITELHLSPEADQFLSELLEKNRNGNITPQEEEILNEYAVIESLVQNIKIHAFANLKKQ